MEQATRSRFLDLLGESIQVLLDHEQPTGAVNVRLHVRDGEPWAASVALDAREGD
jgi:hypothetical protein